MVQIMLAGETLYRTVLEKLSHFEGLAPLALRLYLVPIFWMAGTNKFKNFDSTVSWFGNPDWGLGLPAPALLAFLAAWTELIGGWLLLLGAATRLISIPLMFTMLIAATTAHWDNGWFAIAPTNPDTSAARALAWVGAPGAEESLANSEAVATRLSAMRAILSEHGNTDWLYEKGSIAVLNNGIEFSATYFVLCLVLLFMGAGRYVSVDYWLARRWRTDDWE